MVEWHEMYYGTTRMCVGCGDAWEDGQRRPRPFRRGWRVDAVRRARRLWESALPSAAYDAAVEAEFAAWFGGETPAGRTP